MRSITFAIGDVHGRADLLDRLLGLIEDHTAARDAWAEIVFTGDYVDRGPDSFGAVERVMQGPRRPGDRFVPLRGNHDTLFADAVEGRAVPDWAAFLHDHARLSYAAPATGEARNAALARHAGFLAGLPLTHDDGTRLFVHAGIRPGVPLDAQVEHDLIWIRHEFLDDPRPLPRRIVHGHTIVGDAPVVTDNRVSIDTGAYRSGRLTAAVFDGPEPSFLQAVGEPDRGAIVREAILAARLAQRPLTAAMHAAFDAFVEGRIDAVELAQRTRAA